MITDEKMLQSVQDAIKSNLPEQVGNALRAELAELAELRKKYASSVHVLEGTNKLLKAAVDERDELQTKLNAHGNLEEIAKDLNARELKQELLKLELRLSNERREEIKGLFVSVFRSPIVTKNISAMVPVAVTGTPPSQYNQGSAGFVSSGQHTETSTVQES